MNSMKVTRKELKEMFRDRRIRMAFIMPALMVWLMISFFGFIEKAATSASKQTIYILKTDNPLQEQIAKSGVVKEIDSLDEGQKMIRTGKVGVLVAFEPAPTTANERQVVDIYFDPQKDTSQIAVGALDQVFSAVNKGLLEATLKAHDVPTSAAEPIKVERKEVKVGQGAGQLIASILPYLVVLFAFTGGVSLASDLVAGEKEKNTLETLLITPVGRTEIVLGKFLALSCICLLSSVMALVGLGLAAALKSNDTNGMFKGGFGLTPMSAATIILLLLPLVAFFASTLVAVSSYAKNSREAQTYLALLNVVVILPAVFSQVIGLTDLGTKMWINAVPILNTANNIRNALLGRSDPMAVAITVGVSLILAAIALRVAVWLFNREQVLTRV